MNIDHPDHYARIGRVMKRFHPEYRDFPDDGVGLVAVQKGLFVPDLYREGLRLAGNLVSAHMGKVENGWWGSFFEHGRERRNSEIVQFRVSQAHGQVEMLKYQLEELRIDFERFHLPEILAAEEFIKELQMQLQVDMIADAQEAIRVNAELRRMALQAGMTVEKFVEANFQKAIAQVEFDKKKRYDEWELEKQRRTHKETRSHLVASNAIKERRNERHRQNSRTSNPGRGPQPVPES